MKIATTQQEKDSIWGGTLAILKAMSLQVVSSLDKRAYDKGATPTSSLRGPLVKVPH